MNTFFWFGAGLLVGMFLSFLFIGLAIAAKDHQPHICNCKKENEDE